MDATVLLTVNIMDNIFTIERCVPRSSIDLDPGQGDLDPGQGDLDGRWKRLLSPGHFGQDV